MKKESETLIDALAIQNPVAGQRSRTRTDILDPLGDVGHFDKQRTVVNRNFYKRQHEETIQRGDAFEFDEQVHTSSGFENKNEITRNEQHIPFTTKIVQFLKQIIKSISKLYCLTR